MGIAPMTIELNPFLTDLIEAKLTSFNPCAVAHDRLTTGWTVGAVEVDLAAVYANAPPTLYEPGAGHRWTFDIDVMKRIAQYRVAITALADERRRRLFTVILGSILIHLSNVVINGKGRRYRGGWRRTRAGAEDLVEVVRCQGGFHDLGRGTSRDSSDIFLYVTNTYRRIHGLISRINWG